MSVLSEDFDPRLVLLTIEANYKPLSGDTTPVSGLLVLSRVGLHFYKFDARKRDGTVDRSGIQHYTFADRGHHPFVGTLYPLLPLGKGRSWGMYVGTFYKLGYLASWGSGSGQIIAGISNMARAVAAKDERAAFLEAVAEAEQLAPPLPDQGFSGAGMSRSQLAEAERPAPSAIAAPQVNPHIVYMNYFADASALGPALFYADRALECARLQADAVSPGFFKRRELRKHGWDQNYPLPIITSQQQAKVRRRRAWLLIDGQRYGTLAKEAEGEWADPDPEVMLAYGVAYALLGNRDQAPSFLGSALQDEPNNPRIRAGAAWGLALQGHAVEARQMLASVPTSAREDRQALLLLGCTLESLGNATAALNLYLQSAGLARGYFQGTVACLRALALAKKLGDGAAVQTAQQLTEGLPDQREAWEGLAQAAERAGDLRLARQAREQATAMQGAVLVS